MSEDDYTTAIVPASPGFVLYVLDAMQPRLSKPGYAIVAWAVRWKQEGRTDPVGHSIPISTEGIPANEEYVIEQPDGSFVRPDGQLESSFADMRDALGEFIDS